MLVVGERCLPVSEGSVFLSRPPNSCVCPRSMPKAQARSDGHGFGRPEETRERQNLCVARWMAEFELASDSVFVSKKKIPYLFLACSLFVGCYGLQFNYSFILNKTIFL